MSFSVFRIQPGKLYIKDYSSSGHCQRFMARLNKYTDKISHQDDLFCLVGSTLHSEVPPECANIVTSIFVSQYTSIITDPADLTTLFHALNIHICFDSRGFWRPENDDNERVTFIQRRHPEPPNEAKRA